MAEWVIKGNLKGPQGERGQTGEAGSSGVDGVSAGFGTPTASVDPTTGTPRVEVTATGPDTAKVFSFAFAGLKGETGAQGPQGPAGKDGAQGPQGEQGPQGPAGSDATVTAGNGISVSGGQVSVKIPANSGLSLTSDGLSVAFASDEDFKAYMGIS